MGTAKLGLSVKETGRLSMRTFNRLYEHYKTTWSLEMALNKSRMTYAEFEAKQLRDEEWF